MNSYTHLSIQGILGVPFTGRYTMEESSTHAVFVNIEQRLHAILCYVLFKMSLITGYCIEFMFSKFSLTLMDLRYEKIYGFV